MTFDPMNHVPTTDEEVRLALMFGRDELTGKNLFGIYQCERIEGKSILDAYEFALRKHLEVCEVSSN